VKPGELSCKVTKLQKRLRTLLGDRPGCLVLSALDDVAWLLNMRGSDIPFNPVFFAYCVVTVDSYESISGNGQTKYSAPDTYLFLSAKERADVAGRHLSSAVNGPCVRIKPYADVAKFLDAYVSADANRVVAFSSQTSYALVSVIPDPQRLEVGAGPVALMKVVKNPAELRGFRYCHVRDGAALCRYFAWLEKNVPGGKVDEVSGADQLEAYRKEGEHFVGLSFPTISASGPNGAVIHYRPLRDNCRKLTTNELYLVDSGAQYKDGTTDVTRTVHFGTPSQHEVECFTRVLKGQIGIRTAVFPAGVVGSVLDSFARAALWEVGLDYSHGTGHGVGAHLCVHEGPCGISWRRLPHDPGLDAGMVFSDEPGYYEDGVSGIRIENLVVTVKAKTRHNYKGKTFLTFEDLTLCPIQRKMIDPRLLTRKELDYLNEYHDLCREKVGALLREMNQHEALNWLMKETEPIG